MGYRNLDSRDQARYGIEAPVQVMHKSREPYGQRLQGNYDNIYGSRVLFLFEALLLAYNVKS